MNRYEAILLDKMVELKHAYNEEHVVHYVDEILVLLDCICDFREPPRGLDVDERPCRKCGEVFEPRHPNQRTCDACLGKAVTA